MMKNMLLRARAALVLVAAAGLCDSGAWADVARPQDRALASLHAAHPGAQALMRSGRIVGVYGVPMSTAKSAPEAAAAWLAAHGDVLGEPGLSLRLTRMGDLSGGKFTVLAYEQNVDGVPAELSAVRVLVLNQDEGVHSVVYVGAKVAHTPAGGFLPDALDAELALGVARTTPKFAHMNQWSEPRLVVYFGEGDGLGDEASEWITARRAWAVSGWVEDPARAESWTLFIDAATGALIHARSDLAHSVTGQVQARAITNLRAYSESAPVNLPGATPVPMPGARVNVAGDNNHNVFADATGAFVTQAFTSPSTLTALLTGLAWFNVVDQAEATASASVSVNPGDTATLVLNPDATEWDTSEANAILAADATRRLFLDRAPGATFLNTPLTVNVNVNATCNATFNPSNLSLNFYRSGGGCNNSAYTTVAAHEYGHFVVNRLGLSQGAFGEGFGDSCAILLYDTGIVGDGFRTGATPGTSASYIRNPESANQQYPCSSAIHTCGQVLGGFWREARNRLVATYGAGPGLTKARQLFVDWAQVTVGGSGTNAMTPSSVIEVLTLNDDDGYLENGTPDYQRLCSAFNEHGLSCPALKLIDFAFPNGNPAFVPPLATSTIRFNVVPVTDTPRAGSVRLFTSVNGGAFAPSLPATLSPLEFEGTLPAAPCGATIQYYVLAVADAAGSSVVGPEDAPGTVFSTGAAYGVITVTDTMETNPGWTVSTTATSGAWERADPQPTAAQPGDDTTPSPGVNCWVTGPLAGTALGSFDVDGGSTALTSPVYDLSGGIGHTVSYNRWYSNSAGSGVNEDTFVVQVSNDNGASWTTAETVGPAGAGTSGGWISATWNLADYVAPTNQVRLRFTASDLGVGSLVEAAIDDLDIAALDCTPPVNPCPADLTGVGGTVEDPVGPDGQLTLDDILLFINLYNDEPGCPGSAPCNSADLTGIGGPPSASDGQLTLDDILYFIDSYNEGCS